MATLKETRQAAAALKLEEFLACDRNTQQNCKNGIKFLHDHFHTTRKGSHPVFVLKEIWTANSDDDQIWEQIELTNEPFLKFLKTQSKRFAEWNESLQMADPSDDTASEYSNAVDSPVEETEGRFPSSTANDTRIVDSKSSNMEKQKGAATFGGLNDAFFDLHEMETYLDQEDYKAAQGDAADDSDDVDYFRDVSDGKDTLKYEDFFDSPRREECIDSESDDNGEELFSSEIEDECNKRLTSESEKDNSVDEDTPNVHLSTHEKKLKKLDARIKDMESDNISSKSWQLIGEVTEKQRPKNALLEEHLEFDHMSRTAHIVTEENTKSLEAIIKERINSELWDDVERKVKPKDKPYNYEVTKPLSLDKSSKSLAEVYEEDYLKSSEKQNGQEGTTEDKRYAEIKGLMEKLFQKLDSLTSYEFTPKIAKEDVKIVTNLPALSIEEAVPVTSNDRDTLAPEEIQPKGVPYNIGSGERTSMDKKRQRRKWKKKSHLMALKRQDKEKRVLNEKKGKKSSNSSKILALKSLAKSKNVTVKKGSDSVVRTSTQMFSKIQENMSRKAERVLKDKDTKKTHKLKL